jgi:hypothetical protein
MILIFLGKLVTFVTTAAFILEIVLARLSAYNTCSFAEAATR